MALVNRDKDSSEQRINLQATYSGVLATGVTLSVGMVPWPCTLDAVRVSAFGLSGTPTVDLRIQRFITGTGFTSIAGGMTSLTVPALGTSGIGVGVLASSGNSLLNLQAGDVVSLVTGGSNSATTGLAASLVLKATQDIKSHFGV